MFLPSCEKRKINLDLDSTFYQRLSSQPRSLHPIRASDASAHVIHNKVIEKLLTRNIDTHQLEPSLAERWEVSHDHKVYTFYLRKNVLWHDEKPLTAHDVKFSLQAHQDVSYGGAHYISYFENIKKAEVLNSHTIKFYAKQKYFGSFEKLVTLLKIIPKHIYEGKKTKLNRVLVGSGPYELHQYDRNKNIALKKNKKWWGINTKKDRHHFEKIVFRIINSSQDALMRMEQGQLDYLGLSSESYFKKTSKPPWGTTVLKKKIQNLSPKAYSFIAWNFQNPLFKDKRIRKALSYLMNRKLMNDKFSNNSNYLTAGPIYRQSEYADFNIQPIPFSSEKALQLLTSAGWKDSDQNGILDKQEKGRLKEFRFTLLFPTKEWEKYLTIYQQDLKKNGIDMSLKLMEWVSFTKALDEKNFDAITLAWIATEIEWYPKQIWHSESIANKGSNFISYRNTEVDRLIDSANIEMDRKKRIQLLKKVYRIIVEDHPYSFMFNPKYGFYAYSKRVQMIKPTYNYGIGLKFWWFE